jgi:hypothetical protein
MPDQNVATIAHVIQLAIAPVFLLTGIGSLLAVMANRLARIIDRSRFLEGGWSKLDQAGRDEARVELALLAQRAHLASWAINFSAMAALLVCTLIAALFVEEFAARGLRWLVGMLFVLSMISLGSGIVCFLREVYLATHTLRIGPPPERAAK